MNNEMFLNVREEKMNAVMNQVSDDVRRPLMMLTQYYSKVLNRKAARSWCVPSSLHGWSVPC